MGRKLVCNEYFHQKSWEGDGNGHFHKNDRLLLSFREQELELGIDCKTCLFCGKHFGRDRTVYNVKLKCSPNLALSEVCVVLKDFLFCYKMWPVFCSSEGSLKQMVSPSVPCKIRVKNCL